MSKKVGILFGKERSFPEALINRINQKKKKGIIDQVMGDGEYSDTFASELLKNLL